MKKTAVKRKRRMWLFALLSILMLLLLLSTGKRGFIQQIRLRQERRRLEKEIEALQEEIKQLEEEKEKLNDPEHIEQIARKKYGMAKKNEKVYQVVPKEEE